MSTANVIEARKAGAWPIKFRYKSGVPETILRVACNCFSAGCAVPPPAEILGLISVADGVPHLTLPVEGNEEKYHLFSAWMRACCPHKNMCFAEVALGLTPVGLTAVSKTFAQEFLLLDRAVDQIGVDRFPVLRHILDALDADKPGSLGVESAVQALEEIKLLRNHAASVTIPVLVDCERGDVIADFTDTKVGELLDVWDDDRLVARVDDGFSIKRWDSSEKKLYEVFRSRDFEQRFLEPKKEDVAFTDIASGQRFVCSAIIARPAPRCEANLDADLPSRYPRRVRVEHQQPTKPYRLAEAIGKICEASIKIGNPVHWWHSKLVEFY